MSTDTATAIIALAGTILLVTGTVLAAVIAGRRSDRRERNEQATQQAQRLDGLASQQTEMIGRIWQMQQSMPPPGVVQQNTEALAQHGEALAQHGLALEHTATMLAGLSKRVDEHDETLRTLTGTTVTVPPGSTVVTPSA